MNKTDKLPNGNIAENEHTATVEHNGGYTESGLGGEKSAGADSVHPDDDYRIAAEHANVFIARYFHDKALLRLNPETAAELGISRCEIRNFPQDAFNAGEIAPESADECLELAAKINAGEPEGSGMLRCYNHRAGHFVWYMVNFTSVFGGDGEVKYTVITLRNHTEQRNRDLAYEQYQEYLARLDNGRTAAYEHNLISDICQMSRGTLFDGAVSEGVLDFNSRVLLWGKRVVMPEYSVRCIDFLSKDRLIAAYKDGNRTQQIEYHARIDGGERWIRLTVTLTGSKEGEDIKAFMLHEDVTEAKMSEMTLREQSERDPLTGVLNRKAFVDHFNRLIKNSPDGMNAVIMIDIDFFKNVNDTMGHIVGDRVLQEISERLRGALRVDDIIGRIGGDEFIVCLMGVQSESVIKRRADRLCRLMQEQLSVGISISCSLGSAIYPIDGSDFDSLYNCADVALYAAKNGGRNRNVMYSETTGRETQSRRFSTPIERAYENAHEKSGSVKLYDKSKYADDSIGARFSHAVECLDIILFVYNIDTRETIASQKYSRFVISSQNYLSPDSEQFMVGVHPHDRDMFSRRLMSIQAHGGNSSDMSVRLLLETGEYEWNNMSLMSAADESGRVIEIIGLIKSSDSSKGQASIQLQTLQQHMDEAYMLIEMSEQMRTIFVSESYRKMAGSVEGLCEDPEKICDYSACSGSVLLETVLKNAARSGELTEMTYHTEHDGKVYWRHIRAVRIPYALSDAPVLLVIFNDITEQKDTIQQLANESERLDFLLDVSGMYIVSMQFKDRRTYMGRTCCSVELSPSIASVLGLESTHMDNFPESMIENGIIHAESAQALREITEQVMSHRGVQVCSGIQAPQYSRVIRIRSLTDEQSSESMYYTPVRMTFRLLSGDNGTYTQACGVIERVETIQRSRMLYEQEFRYRELIGDDIVYYAHLNLSQGTVVELSAEDLSPEKCASVYTIEQFNTLLMQRMPMPEDQARFVDQQSAERFMDSLGKALSWSVREYRYARPNGQIQWVSIEMHTLINPYNGDIYCFVYVRDMDLIHKLMVALPQRAEICENCKLYKGESIKGVLDGMMRTAAKDAHIAMIALRIDRFAELRRRMSSYDHSEMLLTIARKLRCIFKGNNIAAHYEDDVFTVLMPDNVSEDTVKAATEQMMTVLRDPSLFINSYERQIVYHFGTCIMKTQSASFDKLYDGCMDNMHFAFAKQKEDFGAVPSRLAATANETGDRKSADNAASDMYVQTVNSTDKDLFRMCAERLAVAGEVGDSIAGVLELVGGFYEATRAYVIELSPDGRSFVNVGQWSADNRVPEIAQGNTVALSCFPGLTMAYEQCKPYIIADARSLKRNGFDAEYELLHSQGINSSYNVPLISGGCAIGFLGIDNPGVQNVDIGAMSAVAFFIVSEMEKRRAVERQKYLITHDALTGLYNRNGYLRLVHTVPPEAMTSLGLAVVDINKLDSINAELGIDFGDILLTHAASTLLDSFSREEVFRYGGGTFYVVCRDITEESFINRIETAMDKLDGEYIGNFSAGYLWVDTVISIDHHLEQAKELLAAAKLELSTKESTAKAQRARRREELLEAIDNGYFVVYLQPKFNSFTGTLIGAEALARMMHPEKGKIKPNRFVPLLEAHGNIRFLDLHIFTSVCKMMREWMDRGVEMFPVSLNFSRATLLEPGIVGTITTIADEHGIPHNLLEIELTETLGDLERETIARIGGCIIDAGFRLSLDDFGAKYSNLSVLSSVRFSALKLDKSLVDSIMSNKMTRSVLDRVISLCAEYGIECIAEGVESVEQQKQLNALGCAHIQGFLYNKPMPAEDFEKKYL